MVGKLSAQRRVLSCFSYRFARYVKWVQRTSLLLGLTTVLSSSPCFSQELTIGFTDTPQEFDTFAPQSNLAEFLRHAVLSYLVVVDNGAVGFKLQLADSIVPLQPFAPNQIEGAQGWSVRIRSDALFQNGRPIQVDDVVYSINRCIHAGTVTRIGGIRSHLLRPAGSSVEQPPEQWIDLTLSSTPDTSSEGEMRGVGLREITAELAHCPVIEQRTSELFGSTLGKHFNIVPSGDFQIVGFTQDREVRLKRTRKGRSTHAASLVTLRVITDDRQGLSALRLGGVDMLFLKDQHVLNQVREDPSLLIASCLGSQVAIRKGLEVRCDPSLDLSNIYYAR